MRLAAEPPAIVSGCEGTPERSVALARGKEQRSWNGWFPLVLLPMLVMALRGKLLPWAFMWLLAAAIFAGCKWLTLWQARLNYPAAKNWKRSAAYLLLWPGMDTDDFFQDVAEKQGIPPQEWFAGVAKALSGLAMIWTGARVVSLGFPILGGWAGMFGLLLLLHFGTFHLLALVWQLAGLGVKPIMQRPLASRSLSELWGKRWNLGFRTLSHTWVFQPLQRRFGVIAGTLAAFLASGLVHEAVISVPARAGYGLPTSYFLMQGLGVIAERSKAGQQLGLGRGARGWLWTALIAVGPVYFLFHPWFVIRVIVPFLRVVAG